MMPLPNLSSASRTDGLPVGEWCSPGRVLVIAEEESQRTVVTRALRAEGFDVSDAASGEHAIEAVRLMAPDVVVLNVCGADTSCFDVSRGLKASTSAPLAVLRLSSADTTSEDRARGLDAGADGYLAYPFDPNELRAAVSALIRLKRREEKRDVSERQSAASERERLLAPLETECARLAAIFREAPAYLAVLKGPDYVFERVNPAYLQFIGRRDVVGRQLLEAIPEIGNQGFIEILDRVRATGEPFFGWHRPVHFNRVPGAPLETRYADMAYQRLVDADGDYSILSHGVDVTEHVLAAESLRRTEQRMRDQFAKFPVPTYLWEARGDDFVLLERNEAALDAFPNFGDEPIGRTARELFPNREEILEDMRKCLRENVVVRRSTEGSAKTSAGRRSFELTIGPQQPDRVLVHAIDSTERTQLEAQLRQAQKMEAVGSLAGGVAHDFNNLLTVIGAHSAFLLESLDSSDPRHEDADAIHQAGIRAAGLTRQLLAFSRKQILKPRLLDLNAIVAETQKMLGRLLGEDIEILTRLGSDLGRVVADASQIDQVLMNLAVNARDAMPYGGVLTIATRNVTLAEEISSSECVVPPGDYAVLEVSDTGVGMDASIQARLFEPFFTTKGPGKGTGLGLATVYGIVKQSGGYILVESAPGFGTTIQVFLPLAATAGESEERQVAEGAALGGMETVLLIEDEPAVREIAKRVLRRQGYAVLEAASGAEALATSAAFAADIDLVISDAVMPGIGGAEAVRLLQEQRPGMKALIMSGYTDDEMVRRGIVSSAIPFVQKPFLLADFARAVRDALDG
jgi:signal transduction histidine kinase/DNA-binding response OmpR family regulator